MDKRGQSEAAAKFISALIKSMQTLCHGYLEFQSGIEIIGHINVSVDKASSLDYVLKEKVCRNHENSTMFVSDTFRAEAKAEELALRKLQCAEQTAMIQQTEGRLSSALSSITSSLAGPRSRNARKGPNKRRSSQDHSSNAQPTKMSHMESSPRGSGGGGGSSPGRSRTSLQTVTVTDGGTTTETLLPQTAGLGEGGGGLGVNLAASVLESVANQNDSDLHRDDDSDNDLEVTFIKEEYGSHGDGSTPDFDPASDNQFVHRGFMPGAFDPGQFPGGEGGPQPGPSGMRGGAPWKVEPGLQSYPPDPDPDPADVQPEPASRHQAESPLVRILVHGHGSHGTDHGIEGYGRPAVDHGVDDGSEDNPFQPFSQTQSGLYHQAADCKEASTAAPPHIQHHPSHSPLHTSPPQPHSLLHTIAPQWFPRTPAEDFTVFKDHPGASPLAERTDPSLSQSRQPTGNITGTSLTAGSELTAIYVRDCSLQTGQSAGTLAGAELTDDTGTTSLAGAGLAGSSMAGSKRTGVSFAGRDLTTGTAETKLALRSKLLETAGINVTGTDLPLGIKVTGANWTETSLGSGTGFSVKWSWAGTESAPGTAPGLAAKSRAILLCGLCDKSFTSPNGLRRHTRCQHSSQQLPFTCHLCGRGFHDREAHQGHVSGHSDTRAWQCGGCDKSFRYKTSLYHHHRGNPQCRQQHKPR